MKNDELRILMREKRQRLSAAEVAEKSAKICEKLSSFEMIKDCKNLMVYAPVRNEVNINSFIEFYIKKNKGVVFPKVVSDELKIYWVDDLNKLEKGYSGILEPNSSQCREVEIKNINLVIVPGLVFDEACNRLGMGKGFYDRFLAKLDNLSVNKNNKKIVGICYDFQVLDKVEKLEVNSHDFPMDVVITESNIYFRDKTSKEE